MKRVMLRNCASFLTNLTVVLFLTLVAACTGGDENQSGACGAEANGEGYGAFQNVVATTNQGKTIDLSKTETGSLGGGSARLLRGPCHGTLNLGVGMSFARLASGSELTAIYTSEAKYEGPDSFVYEFTAENGSVTAAVAYIDVRPCMRPVANLSPSKNVHIVGVYEAHNSQHGFDAPTVPGDIIVRVAKADEPAVLFLASYEPVRWIIDLEAGAKVEKVYVMGIYRSASSVTGLPPESVVVGGSSSAYQWEPSARNDYYKLVSEIRDIAKKMESTFQGCYSGTEFQIPFTARSLIKACKSGGGKISRYAYSDQDCRDKCNDKRLVDGDTRWIADQSIGSTWSGAIVSADGRTLTGSADLVAGAAQTSLGKACGKHYFEMDVNWGGIWWANLVSFNHTKVPSLDEVLGRLRGDPFSPILFGQKNSGDWNGTLGIAMDLDGGNIAYRLNGTWLNGASPDTGNPGASMGLYTYDPVFPAASLSKTSKINANFSGTALRNAPPAGYSAGWK